MSEEQAAVLDKQAGAETSSPTQIPIITPEDVPSATDQQVGEQQNDLSPEDGALNQELLAKRTEAEGKTINLKEEPEQLQEASEDIGGIGVEAAIDNTQNRSDNTDEIMTPDSVDKISQNDKEVAEDMAYAQKEVQDMIANIRNSGSLSQEQKDIATERLTREGDKLAESAKQERLKTREQYEKVSGEALGRILDFQVGNLSEAFIVDTGDVDFSLVKNGMDKDLVDLTYTVLGIEPPTEDEIINATNLVTGTSNIDKSNGKYQIMYSGNETDMSNSDVKGPVRFASITVKRLGEAK